MKKKKIIIGVCIILIGLVLILSVLYFLNIKNTREKYVNFINNNINSLTNNKTIKSNNDKEKIILSYFNNIKKHSTDTEIYYYEKFITDNSLNDIFIKLEDYKSNIKINVEEINKIKNEFDKLNNTSNFIKYLKDNRINKYIINSIKDNYKDKLFNDYYNKEINKLNSNINNYNELLNYIVYLSDNKDNYSINGNTIITNTNEIKNKIKENNLKYNISYSVKKDLTNSKSQLPIFMYHAVDDDVWGIPILFVSPKNFEDQLKYLSENNFKTLFVDEIESVDDYSKSVVLTFDDGYVDFYNNVFPLLKKYNLKANLYVISGFKGGRYVSDEQIKEMSDSGHVLIGSHTVTHPLLSTLSKEEVEKELKESKENLESVTGKKITTFAYPTGDYDREVLEIVPKYYDYSIIMGGGIQYINNNMKNQELRRIGIFSNTALDQFISYCNMSR